jgi:hypothetical protein
LKVETELDERSAQQAAHQAERTFADAGATRWARVHRARSTPISPPRWMSVPSGLQYRLAQELDLAEQPRDIAVLSARLARQQSLWAS